MKLTRLTVVLALGLVITGAAIWVVPLTQAWIVTLIVTLIHTFMAVIWITFAVPFLRRHIIERWRTIHIRSGACLIIAAFIGITVSGWMLLIVGRWGTVPMIHALLGISFILLLLWHVRLSSIKHISSPRTTLLGVTFIGFVLVTGAIELTTRANRASVTAREFKPAAILVIGDVPDYAETELPPNGCADCHADIVRQWQQSIHAVADTEMFYARVVAEFRNDYGIEVSAWCAGCHSPLRVVQQQLNINVAEAEQPNVGCTTCHMISKIHRPVGNHGFDLTFKQIDNLKVRNFSHITNWIMRVQPAAHRNQWRTSLVNDPQLCGSCHRQIMPEFLANGNEKLVLQDTYREWELSSYNSDNPATRRTCQNCHMPSKSHLVPGVNIDVAKVMGAHELYPAQERMLSQAATLLIAASTCSSDRVELTIEVTNSGAGHNLPTGVTDLRQMWLEITAMDDRKQIFFQSGLIDDNGFLDSDASRFEVIWGDENGRAVYFHHISRVRQILKDTTIKAGETRQSKYTFLIPKGVRQASVEIKLLYRLVPQNFINYYMSSTLRPRVVTMAQRTEILDFMSLCTH